MKALLLAIQTRLRRITGVRDSDVFLTPDPDIIPGKKSFPCIGLKDGRVGRTDLAGGFRELSLPVEIYVYEKLIKDDAAILSVFDVAKDIHDELKDHLFDGYVKEVSDGDEGPIQLLYRKDELILRKKIDYEYAREE